MAISAGLAALLGGAGVADAEPSYPDVPYPTPTFAPPDLGDPGSPAPPPATPAPGGPLLTPTPAEIPAESGLPYSLRPRTREDSFAFQVTLDTGADWFHRLPALSFATDPEPLDGRTVAAKPLPRSLDPVMVRFGLDLGVMGGDRWVLPIIGVSVAGNVAPGPRIVTSSDGSLVTMHTASAGAASVLLPGVGVAFKSRRWLFSATARGVATYTWMNVSVTNGGTSTDVIADAWALGLRAGFESCRRLDPTERLCLVIEPHLYESGFFNGGSAGLRWEFGQ